MSLRDDLEQAVPLTIEEELAKVMTYLAQWKQDHPDLMDTSAIRHAREKLSPAALELFYQRFGGRSIE